MGVEAQLPTVLTVITTAAIDSLNPCAIGVLILMVSTILSQKKSKVKLLWLGSLYIFTIFCVYLAAGLGLTFFSQNIPLYVTEYISIVVGTLIVLAGLLEIKDFYWYGRGFSLAIPVGISKKIEGMVGSKMTSAGVIFLGAFVAAVELPCTGAPYLAIITLLSRYFDLTAFLLLILYNIIFVTPLIVILIMVLLGAEVASIKNWKNEHRGSMRLWIGLLLIVLGWLLILLANGTLNFG
jgi:cytochrome c biogenesis protein CcdA